MTSTKHGFGPGQLVRSILLGSAVLAIGATVTEAAAATANNDKFPRLGMYTLAGPQKYDSTFWSYAAKFHVVIINGAYEAWQKNRGYSKETVIQGIKGQSQVGTRVFQYVDINELGNSSNVGLNQFPTWYNKVNANKWWLYAKGTSGTPVTDPQSAQRWIVNMGPNVPVDGATGLGPYGWAAKYLDDYFHLGRYAGTSAAPSLDGFMLDNVLIDPSNGMGNVANGDWLRNGTTQAHNAPTTHAALINGQKQFYSYLASSWPNGTQLGNVGNTFGIAVNNYYSTNASLNSQLMSATSPLSNVIQGGDIEHILGKSFSPEAYMNASSVQLWYRTALANAAGQKLMLFSHGSMQANGSDPLKFSGSTVTAWSPAYQGMRYGLAAALMNNGYYYADDGVYDQETASHRRWFDEFDNSGAGTGYLGSPVAGALGNPQTAAWSNGVWMREFQNGVVLWNPKGNGAKTVSLAALKSPSGHAGLKKLIGHQNPGLNNGAVVTSVTLQDRDGLILLWVTP